MNEALRRALNRQNEIRAAAEAENRDLTESEQREFDTLQAIIDAMPDDGEDPADGSRSKNGGGTPSEPVPAPAPTPAPQPEQRGIAAGIVNDDVVAIANMCRFYNIDATEIKGMNAGQVRALIVRRQMENNTPIASGIHVTDDENDKFSRAVADGVILRSGGTVENPAEGADNFRGMHLRDIMAECLERTDHSRNYRHMSDDALFRAMSREFMNPEAMFPSIMDTVLQKSYTEGLAKANVSFDKFVKFGSLTNFKKTQNHEYLMSHSGDLEKIPENGELKSYVPTDVLMPERQIETYGRKFTLSRKAVIDDDIGMITTLPRRFATLTMTTQNKEVYKVLLNNKPIFDKKVLYSKERKNLLSEGTRPTFAALQKMIYMVGIQKDAAGNQLALRPDVIIVPFGLGVEVQKLLMSPTINTPENTQAFNPYYGSNFTVIEDVTLNGFVKEGEPVPWFVGVKEHMIQVDLLNGKRDATILRADRPDGLGIAWNVLFDFGVSVMFPEASVKNPGTVIEIGD